MTNRAVIRTNIHPDGSRTHDVLLTSETTPNAKPFRPSEAQRIEINAPDEATAHHVVYLLGRCGFEIVPPFTRHY